MPAPFSVNVQVLLSPSEIAAWPANETLVQGNVVIPVLINKIGKQKTHVLLPNGNWQKVHLGRAQIETSGPNVSGIQKSYR